MVGFGLLVFGFRRERGKETGARDGCVHSGQAPLAHASGTKGRKNVAKSARPGAMPAMHPTSWRTASGLACFAPSLERECIPPAMESNRIYFVRIGGQVRGPVRVDQLREMGGIDVITPESEVAPGADGPWTRLATLPICPEVFPARRGIGFKAAKFEEINQGSAPAMNPAEAIEQSLRSPASFRGREVVVTPQVLRGTRDGDPPNDVQEMVLEVGRRVAAHAPVVVPAPPPQRFPRWRWFVTASLLGSAGIMCIPLLYDRKYDAMSTSILGCWTVMFNGLLIAVLVFDRRIGQQVQSNKATMDALR